MAAIRGLKDTVSVPVEFKLLDEDGDVHEIRFKARFNRKTRASMKRFQTQYQKTMQDIVRLTNEMQALVKEAEENGVEPEQVEIDRLNHDVVEKAEEMDDVIYTELVGWSDLKDTHDNDVPYSEEVKKELLASPPYFGAIRDSYAYADGSVKEIQEKN